MKIVVGIVLYNPHIELIKKLVGAIKEFYYDLILVDNASNNFEDINDIIDEKVYIIRNNNNLGIAKALNQIAEMAQQHYADAVLFLDQDSFFPFEYLDEMGEHLADNIGIVAPVIYDSRFNKYILNKRGQGYTYVKKCITSGTLVSIKVWENVGKFDEKLFIDGVDFDFCKRLALNGYKILQNNNAILIHELGEYRKKRLLVFNIQYSWHSSFRTYYIIRNIIYIERKYRNRGWFVTSLRIVKQMLQILFLYEEKKNG